MHKQADGLRKWDDPEVSVRTWSEKRGATQQDVGGKVIFFLSARMRKIGQNKIALK